MRVAICSNQYGERKQLERLLQREADRRISTGSTFYIDAYGSPEAVLAQPMIYDIYFIDYHDEHRNSMLTAKEFLDHMIFSPMFIYDDEDEDTAGTFPFHHIKKPVTQTMLTQIFDMISR